MHPHFVSMIAAWLVCYGHGRRRHIHESGRCMQLPQQVQSMCQNLNIDCQTLSRGHASIPEVIGIVRCKPGNLSAGPLTPWTQEERLLLEYWGAQQAAKYYSLVVIDVWLCEGGSRATNLSLRNMKFCKINSRLPLDSQHRNMFAAESWATPENYLASVSPHDLLKLWGIPICADKCLPLVPVVSPVADMIVQKHWSTILFPAALHFNKAGVLPACHQPFS